MNKISTIGLDIAKSSFSVHGFDVEGVTVLTKELKRAQIAGFFAKDYGDRITVMWWTAPACGI